MDYLEQIDICRKAVEHYGSKTQTVKAIEEMAELTRALCRRLLGEDNKNNLAEELADVEITQEQLRMMFPDEALHADAVWAPQKLERLKKRIEQETAGKKRVVVRRMRR